MIAAFGANSSFQLLLVTDRVKCPLETADPGAEDWSPALEGTRVAVATALTRQLVSKPFKQRAFSRWAMSIANVLPGAKRLSRPSTAPLAGGKSGCGVRSQH